MNALLFLFTICIVPGHILGDNKPLILIWNGDSYTFPSKYDETEDSRVKYEYFCPDETNVEEQLLVPIADGNFNCNKPVKPLLIKSEQLNIGCGIDGKSVYYDFVFRVIAPSLQKYEDLFVHRICYNSERKETIFSYFPMISPLTVISSYLEKEHNEVLDFDIDGYKLVDQNFTKSLKTTYKKWFMYNKLKPLMLVWPSNFGFSIWKKTAYNFFNVRPAWKNVIEMWNIINYLLRLIAIDIADEIEIEKEKNNLYQELNMIQMSGWKEELVLNGEKQYLYLDNGETIVVPKYYWKLAYIREEESIIAIILHNIPDEKYFTESDNLCENDGRFGNRISILKEINENYAWDKFVEFCDHRVITDLYYLPEKLEFLLQKEYLLPLVMTYREGKYELPETYHGLKTEIDSSNQKQVLLCPSKTRLNDSQKQCLIPNESDIPYCMKSVESFDVESKLTHIKCDFDHFIFRDMVYRICVNDEKNANSDTTLPTESHDQVIYSFCLDPTKSRSRFTYHRMRSLNLFNNVNLKNERKINYQSYDYGEINKRRFFNIFKDPYATNTFYFDAYRGLYLKRIPLVPPEDMVFPLLRKATYHIYNMTVAWENIEIINNVIHHRLRVQALLKNEELVQINGVMGNLILDHKIQLYQIREKAPKYLWTVVYNSQMTHGIAIVTHNIPERRYFEESAKLCQSICNIQQWDLDMVSDLNSAAYCCNTNVITEKYDLPEVQKLLEIEELFWPLVLTSYEEKYKFPETFSGLESFPDDSNQKQTFFCPAESNELLNIDEYCLVLNENNTPYCKNSLKYLWVKNDISNIGCSGKNLVDFSVVYRLCFQKEDNADLRTDNQEVFRICYDQQSGQTRYTVHKMSSPVLLKTKCLTKQRKMNYLFDTNDYLSFGDNFKRLKSAFDQNKSYKFESTFGEVHSFMKLMLTSSIFMGFSSLIKPTYHFVNIHPAWRYVRSTWDCIDEKLLHLASDQNQKLIQVNGVSKEVLKIDGNIIYLDDDEQFALAEYFWKVLYNESMTESVAIILHNYPRLPDFNLNKLCKPRSELCGIDARNPTKSVGDRFVYCCESKVIAETFKLPTVTSPLNLGGIQCIV